MRSWRSVVRGRPALSVAMATHNGERFLPQMLESLAAQTLQPDELVVRDDASEDGTVGILQAFGRRAPFRVDVISGGPRLGFAQNFVAASRQCSGGLIFFADQDDTWRRHKLARVARGVRAGDPMAIFHDFALQSDDGTQIAPSFYAVLAERGFSPQASVNGCSIAVTRGFVETWGWPPADTSVSHDVWVALLATAFDQRRTLEEVLIDYRLHEGNTSAWMPHAEAREFSDPGDDSSEVDILIDLLIKRWKVRRWTSVFLEVARERGHRIDPQASDRFAQSLRTNRRRHRRARK